MEETRTEADVSLKSKPDNHFPYSVSVSASAEILWKLWKSIFLFLLVKRRNTDKGFPVSVPQLLKYPIYWRLKQFIHFPPKILVQSYDYLRKFCVLKLAEMIHLGQKSIFVKQTLTVILP